MKPYVRHQFSAIRSNFKNLTAAEQTTVLMMGLALGSRPLKRLSAHFGQKLKPYIVYQTPREAPILQTVMTVRVWRKEGRPTAQKTGLMCDLYQHVILKSSLATEMS
ncbi:uncharacterized protein LOC116801234 [Drosophila sechellia]|uniref:uncharacterized protein LOC116801234 n=1 Tax=Drosophila sechellia TaxID=7238 RepID=UPI0013DDD792|nr:uncharacterized protein LOC116801234 [Drosophila sechellia]